MMPEMDGFEFADEVRRRLNGYVDTIIQKAGDSHETLLRRVSALLDDCGVPRTTVTATDETSAGSA